MRTAYVAQVSDRLITEDGKAFDRDSNKTVVFHAANAVVAMSYTGPAYTESLPTDQWIAQTLWGNDFPDVGGGRTPGVIFNMSGHRVRDLGYSLDQLGRRMAAQLGRIPAWNRRPPEIAFAGWQWKRRGSQGIARPIVATMKFKTDPSAIEGGYQISILPRYWHFQSPGAFRFMISPGGHLKANEIDELVEDLTSNSGALHARDAVVEQIRRVSARSTLVGPDCMCVIIPAPASQEIHVFYMPSDSQRMPAIGDEGLTTRVPASYTPWLVGPNIVMAPSVVVGISPQPLGMFNVIIHGSDPVAGSTIASAVFRQRRPRSRM